MPAPTDEICNTLHVAISVIFLPVPLSQSPTNQCVKEEEFAHALRRVSLVLYATVPTVAFSQTVVWGCGLCWFLATTQKPDCLSVHFKRCASRAVLSIENARGAGFFVRDKATFDVNHAAFLQVLVAGFSQLAPRLDSEPSRFFDLLTASGCVLARGSYAERANRLPAGSESHFGVFSEIANDDRHVVHYLPSSIIWMLWAVAFLISSIVELPLMV